MTVNITILSVRFHHPGSILQSLRQVGGLDVLTASQVGDGAGEQVQGLSGSP
jgi:hypothetical protein